MFAFITIVSIIEVLTDPTKSHEEDAFQEFDESSDYKYTKEANEPIPGDLEEDIEIRAPRKSSQGKIKTPMNMPPIRFTYWQVF